MVINLLPWRDYQQGYEARVIKKIFVSIFITHTLIISALYLLLAVRNHECRNRLFHLTAQMRITKLKNGEVVLHQDLKRNTIKASTLLPSHLLTLKRFFQALQENSSSALCLTIVKHHKNYWLLVGKTKTPTVLMSYLKKLNATSLFSSINVAEINQKKNDWQFRVSILEKS